MIALRALWLHWRVWIIGALVIVLGVLLVWTVADIRAKAVWRERAHVADSTAKVAQRERVQSDRRARDALARDSVARLALDSLARTADAARQRAQDATRDATRARTQRDAAIASLSASQTATDSLHALVTKSTADDSVIAAHDRTIAATASETASLRQSVLTLTTDRDSLLAALAGTRAQLVTDGRVIQQLQGVIAAAHPTHAPRLAKFAATVGVGYCAAPDLTSRLCAAVVAGPSLRVF